MAPVDTGRYSIMNVKFLNLAVLPDPNDESDIVARSDENNAGQTSHAGSGEIVDEDIPF